MRNPKVAHILVNVIVVSNKYYSSSQAPTTGHADCFGAACINVCYTNVSSQHNCSETLKILNHLILSLYYAFIIVKCKTK